MPIRFLTFSIKSKHSCVFLNKKKPKECGLFLNTLHAFVERFSFGMLTCMINFPQIVVDILLATQ